MDRRSQGEAFETATCGNGGTSRENDEAGVPIATRYIDHFKGERKQDLTTPFEFFRRLDLRFNFTLDGAASSGNALVARYSSIERELPWKSERVFCNPPWSSIPQFLEYAPAAEIAVFLVPARVNAKWFHRALELGAKVEYFCGKLKFGGCEWNSPVDCLLLVFTNET